MASARGKSSHIGQRTIVPFGLDEPSLVDSLQHIRAAVERIWASDAPRIIRDFTDHGIRHSDRVLEFATKILQASAGRKLSAKETYVLAAAVYLHDVGMQCDVVKFPEIKERAESIGARFALDFVSSGSSDFSMAEQQAARQNHQFLSAAWIDHAARTGQTALGEAARTVPGDLVDDVMDLCRFHSGMDVSECPLTFKFDQESRKQLIAAVLRFADELDIESTRVSFETVTNFRLSPENAIYWWLHNRCKISFIGKNVVELAVRLHPEDDRHYGRLIHSKVVERFRVKNQGVLRVLRQSGIPLALSADSGIVCNDRCELLPAGVLALLKAESSKEESKPRLVSEVRRLAQVMGYEVVSEPTPSSDRAFDFQIRLNLGTVRQQVLVRCIDGEILAGDVAAVEALLSKSTPQVWLTCETRIAEGARRAEPKDRSIRLFTLADLVREVLNPYIEWLIRTCHEARVQELYVDPKCYRTNLDRDGKETGRDRHDSLTKYLDAWLGETGKSNILLLGEFGSGKTWFCYNYAYKKLKLYLENPMRERLPLFVSLNSFGISGSLEKNIADTLLSGYGISSAGNVFEFVAEMNRQGRILFLLDGFDEMMPVIRQDAIVRNFEEVAKLAGDKGKVMVTSRTEYLRQAKEYEDLVARRFDGSSLARFEIVHVEPFSESQISKALEKRVGKTKGKKMVALIASHPVLADVASKPLLLDFLTQVIDDANPKILADLSSLYLYATRRLLLRNIQMRRTVTLIDRKLLFLTELAFELHTSGKDTIHYSAIPSMLKVKSGMQGADQGENIDQWEYDVRAQTLMHRDAVGNYGFAHKSIVEYFAALKVARDLGVLNPKFLRVYGVLTARTDRTLQIEELSRSFGSFALTDSRMWTVRTFLRGMVDPTRARWLWKLLIDTRGKLPQQVGFLGGNLATVLSDIGESFRGKDLALTVLSAADLSRADLRSARLDGAYMRGVRLSDSYLRDASLVRADMAQVLIDHTGGVKALATTGKDARIVSGSSDGRLDLWREGKKAPVKLIQHYRGPITDIAVDSDSRKLAVSSLDGLVSVWGIPEFRELGRVNIGRISGICFSPDGSELAATQFHDGSLTILDLGSMRISREFRPPHPRAGYQVSYSPDGCYLAVAHYMGGALIWDRAAGRVVASIGNHEGKVESVCFTHDGEFVVTAGYDCMVRVWQVPRWRLVSEMRDISTIPAIMPHPREDFLITGLHGGGISLWDFRKSRRVWTKKTGHGNVFAISFSGNGDKLVTGGQDAAIRVWDFERMECLSTFQQALSCPSLNLRGARNLSKEVQAILKLRGAVIDVK